MGNSVKVCALLLVIPVVVEAIFLSYARILSWLNRENYVTTVTLY